jgi:hypoxanthine phosphoribosyltransferase
MTAVERAHSIGPSIYGAGEIAASVERLASEIAADYREQPLVLLGVLKGALCFTSDLARALATVPDGPCEISVDYLCVERYGPRGRNAAAPRLVMDSTLPLAGRNVVVVDGVADTGNTLAFLRALLECRRPASLRNCVLFDKRGSREADLRVDYLGLPVPNLFVIGYGLDYQEMYRNLPYLAELREGQTV